MAQQQCNDDHDQMQLDDEVEIQLSFDEDATIANNNYFEDDDDDDEGANDDDDDDDDDEDEWMKSYKKGTTVGILDDGSEQEEFEEEEEGIKKGGETTRLEGHHSRRWWYHLLAAIVLFLAAAGVVIGLFWKYHDGTTSPTTSPTTPSPTTPSPTTSQSPTTTPTTLSPIPDNFGYEIAASEFYPIFHICSTSEFLLFESKDCRENCTSDQARNNSLYTYDGATVRKIYTNPNRDIWLESCAEMQGKAYFFVWQNRATLYAANSTDLVAVKENLQVFREIAVFNDKLYFRNGTHLMVSDGTEEGTRSLEDTEFGQNQHGFTLFQGKLVYKTFSENNGSRLFALGEDGNTTTANILINSTASEHISSFQVYEDHLYFRACHWGCKYGLTADWCRMRSTNVDGSRMELIFEGLWSMISPMRFLNDHEFIVYVEGLLVQEEGFGSCGQRISTHDDPRFRSGWAKLGPDKKLFVYSETSPRDRIFYHCIYKGRVIFALETYSGRELWSTDGTNSTLLLQEGTHRDNFVEHEDLLYFTDWTGSSASSNRSLWVTNGTPEGTRKVFDGLLPASIFKWKFSPLLLLKGELYCVLSQWEAGYGPASSIDLIRLTNGSVTVDLIEGFCDDYLVSNESLIGDELNDDGIWNKTTIWYQFIGNGNSLEISVSCMGVSNSSMNASMGLYEGDTCNNLSCISSINIENQSCLSATTAARLLRPLETVADENGDDLPPFVTYVFESVFGVTYSVRLPPASVDEGTNNPLIRLQVQDLKATSEDKSAFPSTAPTVTITTTPSFLPTGMDVTSTPSSIPTGLLCPSVMK